MWQDLWPQIIKTVVISITGVSLAAWALRVRERGKRKREAKAGEAEVNEKSNKRPQYEYCLVEGTYVVRKGRNRTEWLTPNGRWVPYDNDWDVIMNGRSLADEQRAFEAARERFERDKEWWDEHYPQYKKRNSDA